MFVFRKNIEESIKGEKMAKIGLMKKKLIFLTLVVLSVLFLFFVLAWTDNGTSTQNVNDCGTLNTTNAIYTLTQDVNSTGTCFNIQANNITLDCNGYEINYSSDGGDNEYGIYSIYNFTTIKNCHIEEGTVPGDSDYGIYFYKVSNGTIQNNVVITYGYTSYGIRLDLGSNFNTLSNNMIVTSGTYGYGIGLYSNSNSNTLSSNTIITTGDTGVGFRVSSSSTNTFLNNVITTTEHDGYGLYIQNSNSSLVVSNKVTTAGMEAFGFYMQNSNFSTLKSNNVTTFGYSAIGIYLLRSSDSNISSSIIKTSGNYSSGIQLYQGLNCNISSNTISTSGPNGYGINLRISSNSNTLSSNNVTTSGTGGFGVYAIDLSSNNIIINNIINSSGNFADAIYLYNVSSNNLTNNVIKAFGYYGHGIELHSDLNSTVFGNNITTFGDSGYGILLFLSSNSTVSGNNITTSGTNGYGIYSYSKSSFISILNNIITTTGSTSYGIWLSLNSTSSSLLNNIIKTSGYSSHGIALDQNSNSNILINNTIVTLNDGGEGIYLAISSNNAFSNNTITTSGTNGFGIRISSSSNNNTFLSNVIVTSGNIGYGIFLSSTSENILFSGMNVKTNNTNGYAFYILDGTPSFKVVDSILNSSYLGVQELYLSILITGGTWNFTNVTRSNGNPIAINWTTGADGILNMKWYLDAQVNYTHNQTAVYQANVSALNNLKVLQQSGLTNSDGKKRLELLEYVSINNVKTYYSNYTINTTKTGWDTNIQSINLTTNRQLQINIFDSVVPSLNILFPTVSTTYNYHNQTLNFSVSDVGIGLSTCWKRLNSGTNITIDCLLNSTVNTTDESTVEGLNTIYLWANDSLNNLASTSIIFGVSLVGPAINLNAPTNNKYFNNGTNIYFNFTALDSNGIDTCELWGNWTGIFTKNYTWILPTNNTMNFTEVTFLTDGSYIWNVWCNNTLNNSKWALNNFTVNIDTIYPTGENITITTTAGSQTIQFLTNVSDLNLDSCKYSIYNSSNGIDGLNNNLSFACNSLTSATTTLTPPSTFTLFIYAKDKAGNELSQSLSFSTSQIVSTTIIGGASGETKKLILSDTFFVLNTNLQNTINIKLAKDSVRPREKTIILLNKGKNLVTLSLSCDITDVNQSSRNISICDYVKFQDETITISPNEENPTQTSFLLYTPENPDFGENYYFSVVTLDEKSQTYSKLSVSSSVSLLATIFYKWKYIPFQSDIPDEEKSAYPVFLVSLIISAIILILTIMIFQKNDLVLIGLLVGFALFFLSLILLTFIL